MIFEQAVSSELVAGSGLGSEFGLAVEVGSGLELVSGLVAFVFVSELAELVFGKVGPSDLR